MQNSCLTLLVPNLSVLAENSPALNLLLKRAKKKSMKSELINAAVTGLIDGLPTQEGYWLRADPVELRADLSAVYFMGSAQIEEGEKKIEEIKKLLIQDGLLLYTPSPDRYYLKLKTHPKIMTYSPFEVLGKNIGFYLPKGEGQVYWRKLFTEIQMLLHTDIPGIANALWFWGEGYLAPDLIVIGKQEIEQFTTILSQLRCGKLAELRIYGGGKNYYHITRYSIHYFWRNNKITAL